MAIMIRMKKNGNGYRSSITIVYGNLLRRSCCCSCLAVALVFFFLIFTVLAWMSFLSINAGTVHIGDYYYDQVLNVSEKLQERENVGTLPVFKNRSLKASGSCTKKDISISQSPVTTTGIPEFVVQIVNTCMSGCSPWSIHVNCGWFASARMVNPEAFKRLAYDDCLVNGGRPLKSSQIVRFTYSNTFPYPLSFKSARFC